MKGAILQHGQPFFTDMRAVLAALGDHVAAHNWLITDYECNDYPDAALFTREPGNAVWTTGQALLDTVRLHDIQFIWGVFSAFPKYIPFERVASHPEPYADGYEGFWNIQPSVQHPLATMEIVAWDSSLVLLISRDDTLVTRFRTHFPLSEDLEDHSRKYKNSPL